MTQDRTLWQDSARETVSAQAFEGGPAVDLAVIGGGFTGCAAALEAARQGASVALFEAGAIGDGGSGRNVGLVNAGLWLPPDAVIAAAGQDTGMRLLDALGKGPATVFDIIGREDIDCEATRAGTLHLAHSPAGLRDLESRFRQGNRLGAPLQLLDAAETARRTGSAAFHGALLDPRAGTVQPLAYARGLARAAAAAGARIHQGTPVQNIRRDGDGWAIRAGSHELRAGAVLLATNAYHQGVQGLPAPRYAAVCYSQFATAPLPEALRARVLAGGEGCWDTATVMSSFRIDRAGRLILGGIGDVAGPASPVHAAWARRKLRAVFPELADQPFEHAWSGRIAMTGDHLPRVLAPAPNALAVYGYSGRGIAPGTVFGTAAARTLLSGDPAHLPIPVSTTHTERLTGLRQVGIETGAALMHLVRPRPFV